MNAALGKFLSFVRDRLGASSTDYVIILAALCAALVLAALFLDADTQMRLQAQIFSLFGRR